MSVLTVLGVLTLPCTDRSVAYARRFVRDMIGAGHPLLDDAELCTSELVTNAVVHTASTQVTITVANDEGVLRISVADDGAGGGAPYVREDPRAEDPFAEDGRGLHIVSTLAADWGVESRDGGVTTWFHL